MGFEKIASVRYFNTKVTVRILDINAVGSYVKFMVPDFYSKRFVKNYNLSFLGVYSETPIIALFFQFIKRVLKASGGLREDN